MFSYIEVSELKMKCQIIGKGFCFVKIAVVNLS